MKRLLFGLICLLWTQITFASGFALYEGSTRGNALGGLTGSANDAAAIFYNPAGMTQLEGTHIMSGATIIVPWADLEATNGYTGETRDGELEDQVFTPPHLFITHQVNDKLWVGGGLYSRFGLGTKFDPDWDGRYSNISTQIQSVSFGVEFAYKVSDNLSLAAGLSGMWFDAELIQAVDANALQLNPPNNPDTTEYDAIQEITGDTIGYTWDLSAHYHNEKWGVGFFYVRGAEHDLDGVAEWTKPELPVPDLWFADSNVTADTIKLPDMFFFGVSYNHTSKLGISGGVVFTKWSSLQSLVFHYETPFAYIPALGGLDEAGKILNWEDTYRYNVGLEYKMNDTLTLMGGYTYDETPLIDETASYLLPTNSRHLFNTGLSFQREKWLYSAGYTLLLLKKRTMLDRQIEDGVMAGTAEGGAHLISFSASRKF